MNVTISDELHEALARRVQGIPKLTVASLVREYIARGLGQDEARHGLSQRIAALEVEVARLKREQAP